MSSQLGQDVFVDKWLRHKERGFYVDIGCHHYESLSNTLWLENARKWTGLGIDIEKKYAIGWACHRRGKFLVADATRLDYRQLFDDHQVPMVVDYLSLDLEPPVMSLVALRKVMQSGRTFRVITYETDWYRCKETRAESRELLTGLGYRLERPDVGEQDDFWVLP